MQYGISSLSIIPVRREPSEKSEMITQILFGEHFEIFEQLVGWCRIKMAYDGCEGWIDQKMVTPLNERALKRIEKSAHAISSDIFNIIPINKEQNVMIVAGSTLPCWRRYKKEFGIGRQTFAMEGNVMVRSKNVRKLIIDQALKYFNAPYLWGGRSPMGVDCSGFVQIIYKMIGVTLPREVNQQVKCGTAFTFTEEALPGDLAFFDDEEGNIIHVGIIWARNKIIHASGKVRIDNVDQFGIFNVDTRQYSHKMRVMKRIL